VADTSRPVISGDAIIGGATFREGDQQMRQWLIADVSLFDVHLQLWMLFRGAAMSVVYFVPVGDHIKIGVPQTNFAPSRES
jgi:hypothetical protein